MRQKPLFFACALVCAAGLMPLGRSAELVTLRNGFQIQCDRHAMAGGSIRLYLTSGDENYIELPPSQIASFAGIASPLSPGASIPAGANAHGACPAHAGIETPASLRRGGGCGESRGDGEGHSAAPQSMLTAGDLRQMLSKAGRSHNLDVDLLASIVHAESGGNPSAVSRAGARGLMQLMPATAATLGVQDSFQPQQNVSGGTAYLDALLTRYSGNLALALAAYNAGPEAVDHYGGIPPYPETRAYVARVIHEFNRRVLARRAAPRVLPHKLHAAVSQ